MATLAVQIPEARLFSVAVEYAFLIDKKPEVLLRTVEIAPPQQPSIASWHRAITREMRENAESLAKKTITRDTSAFEDLSGGTATAPSPAYALWLKLRGRKASLESERTLRANRTSHADRRPA